MRGRQQVLASLFTISVLSLVLGLAISAQAQEPIDLLSDKPELADGFIRVCARNLRNINLEEQARQMLPGQIFGAVHHPRSDESYRPSPRALPSWRSP